MTADQLLLDLDSIEHVIIHCRQLVREAPTARDYKMCDTLRVCLLCFIGIARDPNADRVVDVKLIEGALCSYSARSDLQRIDLTGRKYPYYEQSEEGRCVMDGWRARMQLAQVRLSAWKMENLIPAATSDPVHAVSSSSSSSSPYRRRRSI